MSTVVVPTHQIGSRVIDLVQEARERVVLISPYLKPWGHLDSAIQSASRRGVSISILFREDKSSEYKDMLKPWLAAGARVGTIPLLHAKVYASESACLLTSMNLLDFSANNSEEFALHSTEPELLRAVSQYNVNLLDRAKYLKPESKVLGVLKSAVGAAAGAVGNAISALQPGTCIRCGNEIDYNPDKPMCSGCYNAWAKFKNPDYAEAYCHDCGSKGRTSIAKPVCLSCYKKSK